MKKKITLQQPLRREKGTLNQINLNAWLPEVDLVCVDRRLKNTYVPDRMYEFDIFVFGSLKTVQIKYDGSEYHIEVDIDELQM